MGQDYSVGSRRRFELTIQLAGTLTTGDDKAFSGPIPFTEGRVVGAIFAVQVNGTSSGSTDFMIERHRAGASVDILAAVASIAHDSSVNYKEKIQSEMSATVGNRVLQFGDQVGLNIDAIPGGSDSVGASVILIIHIDKD